MADTSVKVSFIGDAKKLKSTIDDVDREMGGLGKKSQSFGSKIADNFGKIAPALAVVGTGVTVLGSAVKAAMDDAAEQATLATTLKNVTNATSDQIAAAEKWIDTTQRATGVADSQLRPALGLLTRQTGDVTEAQKLLGVAMDVSQGTGKDLNTVAGAMVKILEGNTGAASRLVPELTGIAREGAPASEVMDALAKTFAGQTAEHAGTLEGKFSRLNIAFGEMQEKLGEKLLPLLTEAGDWLIETGIPKFEEIAGKAEAWWKKQDDLRRSFKDGFENMKDFTIALGPLGEEAWEAYQKVEPLVNALVRVQQLSSGVGAFSGQGKSVQDIANERLKAGSTAITGGFQLPGPIPGRASGGGVSAGGAYVVGENGPELLQMGARGGYVHPNMGGGQAVVLNIDGRSFMTWLIDYSRDVGGIPLVTREAS